MELSRDYKKDSLFESASRRLRANFSVMASASRIDILRILNSKGPLTYSELKAYAGFKSKKESGKFAYHLRKLLRQSLVALNKGERRYAITNLGRFILSLARQIEERTIVESGKTYVRTSDQRFQEFSSHKIEQSLVREANMPTELAHKVAEEVEARVYKFQISYLTSSLIREIANSVLVEQEHEEYRHKLARLGLSVFDVENMLGDPKNKITDLFLKTAYSVFSEYLLFNALPKDITDHHFGGDIHISNSGVWSLMPDTVFVDVSMLDNLELESSIPRFNDPYSLVALTKSLSKESIKEVVLDNFMELFKSNSTNSLSKDLARILMLASLDSNVITSLRLETDNSDSKDIDAILKGYENYVKNTPIPNIALIIAYKEDELKDHIDSISSIIRAGGLLTLSRSKNIKSMLGVSKNVNNDARNTISLQSVSINLPRLAYESNKDEVYFRAKLAMILEPAISALFARRKMISDLIGKGMLSALATIKPEMNFIINLVDLHTPIVKILGYDEKASLEIMKKVINTSIEVSAEKSKRIDANVGIAVIADESSQRFATLDIERYGKTAQQVITDGKYSQGMIIPAKELLTSNEESLLLDECNVLDSTLNGGLSVMLDLNGIESTEVKRSILLALDKVQFFMPIMNVYRCSNCGRKSVDKVCDVCKSSHMLVRELI